MSTSLANHFLIAMPAMDDPVFNHAVIYVCEHHEEGSVGLVINQPTQFSLDLVFKQLKIVSDFPAQNQFPLLFGGPLQPERGFVMHRPMGSWRSSLLLHDEVTVTTSNDIIRAMAINQGPKDFIVAMGFAAWQHDQLEKELLENQWLVCPFSSEIVYDVPYKDRWNYAGKILGVDMNILSSQSGSA